MTVNCASCDLLKDGVLHTAEGWLCGPCLQHASTRIETIYINGKRFHRCLKGVQKQETPVRSGTEAFIAFHRNYRKGE